MSNYFNKNVDEGLFNPKTTGTDYRVTQGLSPLGQQYGQGAIEAQRQALAGYQGIASGTTPSLAQMQFEQGLAQNQRAAMGLMGAQRGGNIAGAYGQALGAQQGANLAGIQQGAMLRAQEQQMAYAGMGQLAGQMAGQQFGYDQLNQQSLLGLRGQDLNYNLGRSNLDMQRDQNAFNNAMAIGQAATSGAGSLFGGAVGLSDERVKVGLGALPPGEAGARVGEVQPIAWDRYSDPSMGNGQPAGVSAQQLEGTSLGGLVRPGPDGLLRVDAGGAATTALAASADQEHRLRAMEARLAQIDPYASPEMRTMGQEYEHAQEGPYRTSLERRRMANNEREAQRGLDFVRSATPPDQFAGAPQMQRGQATREADPQYAAIMSQPGRYSSPEFVDSPSPFGPEPVERQGLQPRRKVRRRRGLVQVQEGGGEPMKVSYLDEGPDSFDPGLSFTPEGERGVGPGASASPLAASSTNPFTGAHALSNTRRIVDREITKREAIAAIESLPPEQRARYIAERQAIEAAHNDLRRRQLDLEYRALLERGRTQPEPIRGGGGFSDMGYFDENTRGTGAGLRAYHPGGLGV